MKKQQNIHIMEYYSTIKKNEIIPFASAWTDIEIIIVSEATQTKIDITYMWNFLKYTNELIYKTEIDSQTYGYRRGGKGGVNWEYWINRYTLLYIK